MILSRFAPRGPLQCLRQASTPFRPPLAWARPIIPAQHRRLITTDELLQSGAAAPPPPKSQNIAATTADTPVDSSPPSSTEFWNNQFEGISSPASAGDGDTPPPSSSSSPTGPEEPSQPERLQSTQARVVPFSPSYFSRAPLFNDHLVYIDTLLTKYEHLPLTPPEKTAKVAWKGREAFAAAGEHIAAKQYAYAMHIAKRLNQIHPSIMPTDVSEALLPFKKDFDPNVARIKVIPVDKLGRAVGVGRRKRSTARAWVIEGTGEVIINGKSVAEAFARVHDRESAIWALRVTERMDKYNVYALVEGGGTTGQAEAVAMAVAMGMMGHEPDLKPALRRAGCVTRDPREVERKKPGRLKARKRPAWNAR